MPSRFGDDEVLQPQAAQGDVSRFGDPAVGAPSEQQPSATKRFFSSLADTTGIPQAIKNYQAPQSFGDMVRQGISATSPSTAARLAMGILKSQGQQFKKSYQALTQGDYPNQPLQQRALEAAGYGLAGATPIVGPMAAQSGEQLGSGDVAGGLGTATGTLAQVLAPEAAKAVGTRIAPAAKGVATDLYMKAMKPSTSLDQATRAKLFQTAQAEGIPVSQGGLAKAGAIIDGLQSDVSNAISQSTAAPISKFDVARRLNDTAQTFSKQAAPTGDLNKISDVGNDFLASHPDQLPPPQAQELKTGTNAILRKKGAYGEQGAADIEAEKAIVRGLKEELQNRIPVLQGLNAREGANIQLEGALQRAVGRIQNANIIPLRSILGLVAGGLGGGMHGGLVEGAAASATAGLLAYILDDPLVKSRLAIAIGRAADAAPNLPTGTGPALAAPAAAQAIQQKP